MPKGEEVILQSLNILLFSFYIQLYLCNPSSNRISWACMMKFRGDSMNLIDLSCVDMHNKCLKLLTCIYHI